MTKNRRVAKPKPQVLRPAEKDPVVAMHHAAFQDSESAATRSLARKAARAQRRRERLYPALTGVALIGIVGGLTWWGLWSWSDPIPECTDEIAVSGGICQGTPEWVLSADVVEHTPYIPVCQTEDSTNCYWDASRGNGEGLSFIDWDGERFILDTGKVTITMPNEESTYPLTDAGIPCWQNLEEDWQCFVTGEKQ